MNYVKGTLKLKGKAAEPKPVVGKVQAPTQLLDKRNRGDSVDESEPKIDKKVKPSVSVAKPPEKEEVVTKKDEKEEEKEIIVKELEKTFKTDYEKRIYLQKQQKLKNKIDQRLKHSHRDRVEQYNRNLCKLPDHFDIPKVGPG